MIQLLSCGYHFVHREGITIDRPNGAGNYAFVLFKSESEVILKGQSMVVEKNTYMLFHPSSCYLYREVEKPFVNDWFHCEGESIQEFLEQISFPMDEPIKAADPLLISRSIMDLHNMLRLGGPHGDRIMDYDIKSLLMKLSNLHHRSSLPDRTNRYYLQLSELRNELYRSPAASYSVNELAAKVNMSKSYFQHTYKELFGCSVITDIINGRLEYARYLLDNSSSSIAQIAKMCGYENETHFMRQFKKFTGVTPSQYKRRPTGNHLSER
jgi:AraC family transcriptional regulator, arabinose operon regulatory protein